MMARSIGYGIVQVLGFALLILMFAGCGQKVERDRPISVTKQNKNSGANKQSKLVAIQSKHDAAYSTSKLEREETEEFLREKREWVEANIDSFHAVSYLNSDSELLMSVQLTIGTNSEVTSSNDVCTVVIDVLDENSLGGSSACSGYSINVVCLTETCDKSMFTLTLVTNDMSARALRLSRAPVLSGEVSQLSMLPRQLAANGLIFAEGEERFEPKINFNQPLLVSSATLTATGYRRRFSGVSFSLLSGVGLSSHALPEAKIGSVERPISSSEEAGIESGSLILNGEFAHLDLVLNETMQFKGDFGVSGANLSDQSTETQRLDQAVRILSPGE